MKSLSDYAKEDDAIASGSMDFAVGNISNQKELRPENFENAMMREQQSITTLVDVIKKKEREEKMRNAINAKETKNKKLYENIERKLKDRTLLGSSMEIT
jgi:hypothetical protein